jgi:hypothetical protein
MRCGLLYGGGVGAVDDGIRPHTAGPYGGSHPATTLLTGSKAGGVCFATSHIELRCDGRQIGKSHCP